jgi:hypothetical protein
VEFYYAPSVEKSDSQKVFTYGEYTFSAANKKQPLKMESAYVTQGKVKNAETLPELKK